MKVRDVMTAPVAAVRPEAKLGALAELMASRGISGVPVTDETGHVLGIVTEGDLLRRVELGTVGEAPGFLRLLFRSDSVASDYVRTHARKVADIMTREVATVAPDDDLSAAVALMEKHHVRRVPVVAQEKLVGIVSRADLVRALAAVIGTGHDAAAQDDEAIRAAILAELGGQAWAPRGGIHIGVEHGAVTLDGVVFSDEERRAILVAVENVAGVTSVRDQLVWLDPTSGITLDPPRSTT